MFSLIFSILILYFYTTLAIDCPSGSLQIPQEDKCLFTTYHSDSYRGSLGWCQRQNATLVQIRNAFENNFIFNNFPQLGFNAYAEPFIGLERTKNGTWIYTDGTFATYQHWDKGEPNMTDPRNQCVYMDQKSGFWKTTDCWLSREWLCSYDGNRARHCLDGWVFSEKTGFCYYLQNFTYPDGQHWALYDLETAEKLCVSMGETSRILSIHSDEENDFVLDLIKANVKNMTNVVVNSTNSCGYSRAWMGLVGRGALNDGWWDDDTWVDYTALKQAYVSDCVWEIANDESCEMSGWRGTFYETDLNARFVCKMEARKGN